MRFKQNNKWEIELQNCHILMRKYGKFVMANLFLLQNMDK